MAQYKEAIDKLCAYVESLHSVIYINTFNYHLADNLISRLDIKANVIEYSKSYGIIDFDDKHPILECDIVSFFKQAWDEGTKEKTFIICKDINEDLNNPEVISLIKRIAEDNFYKIIISNGIYIKSSTS